MTTVETERRTPRRVARKTDGTTSSAPKRLRSPVDQQRAEFLRRCRARIDPAELGLPRSRIRRTEGLRREDVASLSGVSACWYAWLEQGRDMRVSDDVLERLSQTLRLSEDERVYLFSLVQHRAPRVRGDSQEEAPADVVRLINALSVPAIAVNLRWDVLAWNRLNSKIYRDYAAIPLNARLRFDYSKHADDPKFEALIRRLSTRSPLFRRLWRMPEFTLRPFGIHRFTHPKWGELAFEHTSCTPDGYPHIRMVICTPENAAARAAIAQMDSDVLTPAT